MRPLKRLLETYLGVPEVRPGQDTAWDVSVNWPWTGAVPAWLLLLGLLLLAAGVVAVYWRDAKAATLRMRVSLAALRAAQIALLVIFLSNVTLSVDGTELPVVVVLIDRSASMKLDDHYSAKPVAEAAQTLLKETGTERPSRLNLAKALLTREEGRFLKELQRYHRLHIYEFASESRRFDKGEFLSADEVDAVLPRLKRDLQPDGESTNHRAAIKRILDDFSGSPPAAIVLLSDGITTSGPNDRLSDAAGAAERQNVAVFAVALGSTDPARDVQLTGLLAPDVAFLSDPVTFTADLRVFGVDEKRITLRLRRKGRAEVLASRSIRTPPPGKTTRVELLYTPTEEGEFEYVLEAVPVPRETNTANNRQTARLAVRRETLKVLLADSVPRYEFRYLKHLLEREKTITVHTILQEADLEYAAEDESARALKGRFPIDRKRLQEYDAVILGDVDVSVVPREVLENIGAFVRNGGSLILIAGTSYNPTTYRNTPLEKLLPFELDSVVAPPDDADIDVGYLPVLTGAGRGNPAFQLARTGGSNESVWQDLPKFYWLLEIHEPKPGAQVFLKHPTRQTRASGRDNRRRPLPVVLMHRVGAGKVLFHATDETWRWRELVGDLYFGRYWVQTLRALSRSKLAGQSREAELESDRSEYVQGQTVRLSLRFFDEKTAPADDDGATVVVERDGTAIGRVTLRRVPHLPSAFSGELTSVEFARLPEGRYRAWVATPAFPRGTPSTAFTVIPPQRELQARGLDQRELKAIAEATHGEYVTLERAASLPSRLPAGTPTPLNDPQSIPLWNRWELMLLFALFLTCEWLLRKRLRLI